jgi:hypothetical protein
MAKTSTLRKHPTRAQRDKILKAYQASQLSQREFAARAGIGLSTLYSWLRKAAPQPAIPAPAFVEVPNLLAPTPAARLYRVHLAGGIEVEVGSGFVPEELAALLQLLRAG